MDSNLKGLSDHKSLTGQVMVDINSLVKGLSLPLSKPCPFSVLLSEQLGNVSFGTPQAKPPSRKHII